MRVLTDMLYQLVHIFKIGDLRIRNINTRFLIEKDNDAVKVERINVCLIT